MVLRKAPSLSRKQVWQLIPASLAVLIFAFIARKGLKTTSDSIEYQCAALSLYHKGQLLHCNGEPFVYLSPLYPIILSLFGNYILPTAWFINCLSLFFVVFLWQSLAKFDKKLSLIYGLNLSFSTGIQIIASFLWTEMLFLLMWVCLMSIFVQLDEKKTSYGRFCVALWLMVMIPFQRNAGIFLIMALSFNVLRFEPRFNMKFRLALALCFVSFALWSFISKAAPLRKFEASEALELLLSLTQDYAYIFWGWFLPVFWIPKSVLAFGFVLVLAAAILTKRHKQTRASVFGFLAAFYTICLIGLQVLFDFGQKTDSERYLVVCFPMYLYWIFAFLKDTISQKVTPLIAIAISILAFMRLTFNIVRWEI